MATKRITVSVPAEIATQIKRAAGRTHSVSEWVTNAVTRTLEEENLKRRFLELSEAVPATPAEERQARASFERIVRPKKSDSRRGKSAA